jgi:hypothetical protein
VLTLLHSIVQLPVTSQSGDTLTWGPGSNALDAADYKLDVIVIGDGTYDYTLSGRSKLATGSQFEVVLSGTADPRAGDLQGRGDFHLDFDAGKRVNPIDSSDANGVLDVNYDLAQRHLDLAITSTDALGQPLTAAYAYNDDADGAGDMTFALAGNAGGGPAMESVTLQSRWLGTGAGRADARISGGDLGALEATASECWSTSFQRVFYIDAITSGGTLSASEGSETACAFASAALPLPE